MEYSQVLFRPGVKGLVRIQAAKSILLLSGVREQREGLSEYKQQRVFYSFLGLENNVKARRPIERIRIYYIGIRYFQTVFGPIL
jgi:hypothetical protein